MAKACVAYAVSVSIDGLGEFGEKNSHTASRVYRHFVCIDTGNQACIGLSSYGHFGSQSLSHSKVYIYCSLWLVHTANTDKTRLVLSVSTVWTELVTRQDCLQLKILKQFCPVSKCGVNRVLSCFQLFATWLPTVTSYLENGSRLLHKCVHTADKTG